MSLDQPSLLGDDGALVLATGAPFLCFEVPGPPGHKGRHRARMVRPHGKQPFITMYPDPATAAYETVIAQLAAILMRGRQPTTAPLALLVHAFKEIPKSWSYRDREAALSGRIVPTGKPDFDNFIKAAADAMNKIVYGDDSQIIDGRCIKKYSDTPALRIEVREFVTP